MNIQSSKRHSAVTFASFAILSSLAFGLAFEPGQSIAAAPGVIAETNQLLPTATNRADTESYTLEIKPVGTYAVGKEGFVDVMLTTKSPYHVNEAYPYKFRVVDPAADGVTYPKPLLARADGKFDEKTGTFHVPFVVSKAGKTKVGGTFSLSVCSTSNCLMEKVDLELDVDVK